MVLVRPAKHLRTSRLFVAKSGRLADRSFPEHSRIDPSVTIPFGAVRCVAPVQDGCYTLRLAVVVSGYTTIPPSPALSLSSLVFAVSVHCVGDNSKASDEGHRKKPDQDDCLLVRP